MIRAMIGVVREQTRTQVYIKIGYRYQHRLQVFSLSPPPDGPDITLRVDGLRDDVRILAVLISPYA